MKKQKSKVAQRTQRVCIYMPNNLYHAIKLYQQNQEIPSSFTHCASEILMKGFEQIEQIEKQEKP